MKATFKQETFKKTLVWYYKKNGYYKTILALIDYFLYKLGA